jgi:RNAse (barnase) inhibitor barstar
MVIEIDFERIKDRNAVHSIFSEAMGFPGFYGNNNNAWIDCMSYIDDEAK